jgi:hypothetical protein
MKQSHHAQFDKAWYLQPHRPLAAQLLYDLGLEAPASLHRSHCGKRPLTVAAVRTYALTKYSLSTAKAARVRSTSPSNIVTEYLIGKHDMTTIYMSPDPYFEAFEEIIDLQKFDIQTHHTGGLSLLASNNWLILGGMAPGTPGAKIPQWRS